MGVDAAQLQQQILRANVLNDAAGRKKKEAQGMITAEIQDLDISRAEFADEILKMLGDQPEASNDNVGALEVAGSLVRNNDLARETLAAIERLQKEMAQI